MPEWLITLLLFLAVAIIVGIIIAVRILKKKKGMKKDMEFVYTFAILTYEEEMSEEKKSEIGSYEVWERKLMQSWETRNSMSDVVDMAYAECCIDGESYEEWKKRVVIDTMAIIETEKQKRGWFSHLFFTNSISISQFIGLHYYK